MEYVNWILQKAKLRQLGVQAYWEQCLGKIKGMKGKQNWQKENKINDADLIKAQLTQQEISDKYHLLELALNRQQCPNPCRPPRSVWPELLEHYMTLAPKLRQIMSNGMPKRIQTLICSENTVAVHWFNQPQIKNSFKKLNLYRIHTVFLHYTFNNRAYKIFTWQLHCTRYFQQFRDYLKYKKELYGNFFYLFIWKGRREKQRELPVHWFNS